MARWQQPKRLRFDAQVSALSDWVASHGRLPRYCGGVKRHKHPQKRDHEERRLAKFMANQCQALRGTGRFGTLTDERIAKLSAIPGVAERFEKWKRSPDYEESVRGLEKWVQGHQGHCGKANGGLRSSKLCPHYPWRHLKT